jgi:hypothetical protein
MGRLFAVIFVRLLKLKRLGSPMEAKTDAQSYSPSPIKSTPLGAAQQFL